MTKRIGLQSLKLFTKRLARMRRIAHHDALDLVASKLGKPHWNALMKAWENGWRPEDAAVEALSNIDEATDPVMDIPILGLGLGVEERGELDGHPYLLRIDFEVVMAEVGCWGILLGHAPSDRPLIEIYDQGENNPILDPAFKAKALTICGKAVERLRARIAADWPRRSTKPDTDGQAEHPLSKGVSNKWHCLHCEEVSSGVQMAENMWHCPKCSATPMDIFIAPFWKQAS